MPQAVVACPSALHQDCNQQVGASKKKHTISKLDTREGVAIHPAANQQDAKIQPPPLPETKHARVAGDGW